MLTMLKMTTYEGKQSPGHFQDKMNEMFQGFEFICSYIDNMLVFVTRNRTNFLYNLKQVIMNIY